MNDPYPFLSERVATVFAGFASAVRDCDEPRDQPLAERYRKASDYLRSRIGRGTLPADWVPPVQEAW